MCKSVHDALTPNISGMTFMAPGTFTVRFAGIPRFTYHIEHTGSLSSLNWTDIGSMTAPEGGQVVFTDSNAPIEVGILSHGSAAAVTA